MKRLGDLCMKCGIGHFDVVDFIPDIKSETRDGRCLEHPPEEHLHLACDKCWFTVWDETAEQERAKLS
jgi:hypothetical protein